MILPFRNIIVKKFVGFGFLSVLVICFFDVAQIAFKNYVLIFSSIQRLGMFFLLSLLNFAVLYVLFVLGGYIAGHLIVFFSNSNLRIYRIKILRILSFFSQELSGLKTLHYLLAFILIWFILIAWIIHSPLDALNNPSNPLKKITSSTIKKPDVFLVVLDTLRSESLFTYGYDKETMPHLSQFAEEATLFKNTISTSSFTPPSHLSIISGSYVDSEIMEISTPQTLTEILKSDGYGAVCVSANRLVTTENFVRGFDIYVDCVSVPALYQYFMSFKFLYKIFHNKIFNAQFLFYHKHTRAEDVNASLFPLLHKHKNRNLFLFVNYLDPHDPYFPHKLNPVSGPLSLENGFVRRIDSWRRPDLAEDQWSRLNELYDQELEYLDIHLGDLFEKLKDLGLWEDSIVIVTSDHGELIGENRRLGHGVTLYENEIKVPLFVKYPKIVPQNIIVEDLVQTVDIVPTILDLLDISVPGIMHGKSLLPLVGERQETDIHEYAYISQYNYRAIRNREWKYIRNLKDNSEELYNIKMDPDELKNLEKIEPEKRKELAGILDSYLEKYDNFQSRPKSRKDRKDLLRALGYVK